MSSNVDRFAGASGAGRAERRAGRVRCAACATEQEASAHECVLCGASLDVPSNAAMGRPAPPVADGIPSRGDGDALPTPIRHEIPPVEVHERPAPSIWRAAPLGLIATAAVVLWVLFGRSPRPEEARRRRQVSDVYALAGKVRAYRAKVGFALDETTWKAWIAARTDPHLFDPWGNPYGYRPGDKSFTITAYGADGAPGGQGADKDTEFAFRSGSGMPASANNGP